MMTAYIQALSLYLLEERPIHVTPDLYYIYPYNRFQASRYGFEGNFIDPSTAQHHLISEDILATIKNIERYANQLNTMGYLSQLLDDVINKRNDAALLRQLLKQSNSFPAVVAEQCKIWIANTGGQRIIMNSKPLTIAGITVNPGERKSLELPSSLLKGQLPHLSGLHEYQFRLEVLDGKSLMLTVEDIIEYYKNRLTSRTGS